MRKKTTEPFIGKFGKCTVVLTKDAGLWHLSISHKNRLPRYEELKAVRYALMPDVEYVAQIFPPPAEFVNLHENCLHLWELSGNVIYSEQVGTHDRQRS